MKKIALFLFVLGTLVTSAEAQKASTATRPVCVATQWLTGTCLEWSNPAPVAKERVRTRHASMSGIPNPTTVKPEHKLELKSGPVAATRPAPPQAPAAPKVAKPNIEAPRPDVFLAFVPPQTNLATILPNVRPMLNSTVYAPPSEYAQIVNQLGNCAKRYDDALKQLKPIETTPAATGKNTILVTEKGSLKIPTVPCNVSVKNQEIPIDFQRECIEGHWCQNRAVAMVWCFSKNLKATSQDGEWGCDAGVFPAKSD